jgi:hypothetical protein
MESTITEEVKEAYERDEEVMLSSEDEEDIKEELRERSENIVKIEMPGMNYKIENLVVCMPGTPQALMRIVGFGHLREIGHAESKYHSGSKTHTTMKIFRGETLQ